MRYDTPIYFQRKTSIYNTDTGNYDDTTAETKVFARVTDSGVDTLNLIYGKLKQGSLTVRLLQSYKDAFDFIRIGKKTYRVDFSRGCKVFVVSEVQGVGKNQD